MARGGYRPGSGRKAGKGGKAAESGPASKLTPEEAEIALAANLTPLEYMLKVMNDPKEEKELRARMAQAAAPYMHTRRGEGGGKKEEQDDRAKIAHSGKFAAGKPPALKVVN